jgi:hypothetical protein
MNLQLLDPKHLRIFSNDRDLLRDLFTYMTYVREHRIKRMTRTNEIPRTDSVRIAKLMGDPELVQVSQETGGAQWIDFIDELALRLKLVSYDTRGKYRGYSSSGPSFTENYVDVSTANYKKFLELSPAMQEKQILDTLVQARSLRDFDDHSNNEFYKTSVLGELDSFGIWGSATGLMPTLKFPQVRLFLLNVLKDCDPGQWYSTASLVAYLKASHPYFLIPENTPKADRWGKVIGRYDNFHEGENQWQQDNTVPPNAPDAFERVEGRYVERFLEGIPLTMRFLDVAYDPKPYKGILPMRGTLKAFRINERFLRLMRGQADRPRLTVQPNFDVIIESDFFPAGIVQAVAALGEEVSSPNSGHSAYVGIFQLKKTLVAAEQVRQPDLDVVALLEKLSGHALPPNVKVELEEWSGHADQFTLYEGFALLESVEDVPEADKYTLERIGPTFWLTRASDRLFAKLETNAYAPLRVRHPTDRFALLGEATVSRFPRESAAQKAHPKPEQVKVSRNVAVTMKFPDEESFDSVRRALAELRCPFQSDIKTRAISFDQQYQAKFDEAVQQLSDRFAIEIE